MEAGKSLKLLVAAYELRQKKVNIVVLTALPIDSTANMKSEHTVSSRIGKSITAVGLAINESILDIVNSSVKHILVDEAQFLTAKHVGELRDLCEKNGQNVDCYGLRTDFQGEFFPGSLELMRCADELVEVPCLSGACHKPATHNMRLGEDGLALTTGDKIALKTVTKYVSRCYSCWKMETEMAKSPDVADSCHLY